MTRSKCLVIHHDVHDKESDAALKTHERAWEGFWQLEAPDAVCRTIYGLVASQVGDFENEMTLASGDITTPAKFIRNQYGYEHSFLGQLLRLRQTLSNPFVPGDVCGCSMICRATLLMRSKLRKSRFSSKL